MKILSITLIFCAAVAAVLAKPEKNIHDFEEKIGMDDNNYDINRAIIDFIKGKFGIRMYYRVNELMGEIKKDCVDFDTKLNLKINEIHNCTREAEHKLGSDTICRTVKDYFFTCSEPMIDLISSCLPPQSKDIPKIAEKTLEAFVQKACGSTVEQVIELFNPCQLSKPFSDFPSCEAIKAEIETFSEKYPTTAFICSLIPKYRKCSNDRQESSCPNPVSKSAFTRFYEVADDATKSICENAINNKV